MRTLLFLGLLFFCNNSFALVYIADVAKNKCTRNNYDKKEDFLSALAAKGKQCTSEDNPDDWFKIECDKNKPSYEIIYASERPSRCYKAIKFANEKSEADKQVAKATAEKSEQEAKDRAAEKSVIHYSFGYRDLKFGMAVTEARASALKFNCNLIRDGVDYGDYECNVNDADFGKALLTAEFGDKGIGGPLNRVKLILGFNREIYAKAVKILGKKYKLKKHHTVRDEQLTAQGVLSTYKDDFDGGRVQLQTASTGQVAVVYSSPERQKLEEAVDRGAIEAAKLSGD